jgi:hypothetical protein
LCIVVATVVVVCPAADAAAAAPPPLPSPQVIAKVAFRMFLGVTAECRHVVDPTAPADAPPTFHLILVST